MPKQKVPLAADRLSAQIGPSEPERKATDGDSVNLQARKSPQARTIEAMSARIAELEDRLLQRELDETSHAQSARLRRLERDVATYREARTAAEFIATDLRSALDHSGEALARLKTSPAFQLGTLLLGVGRDWRLALKLPGSLARWGHDSRRHRREGEARLIPTGSAIEFTAPIEQALELAETQGLREAERWVIDQRLRAPVNARVLSELATFARVREPGEAVRLAQAALASEPNEARVKRLAFLMAEAGSVTDAAQLLRAAIEQGATFNKAQEVRAQDILALADLSLVGLVLMPRRNSKNRVSAARRVLIFSTQAYPFHWNSVSIRCHAMARALVRAGFAVDVATVPGYPNIGRREPVQIAPIRKIDGVDYHILAAAAAPPGLGRDYLAEASKLLLLAMRRLGSNILIAPAELLHGYPAAMAAQVAGASLILDCASVRLDEQDCRTETSQVLSRIESQLYAYADTLLAGTLAIEHRLRAAAPEVNVRLIPNFSTESTFAGGSIQRADAEDFVFGYVGDNSPDIDIGCLSVLLSRLLDAQIDARLVIYSVGARVQAVRNQLELGGLGDRVKVVEKSPPGRRMALAYDEMDVVVVPLLAPDDVIKSPTPVLAALRHHKCTVALGVTDQEDMFGSALIHAADMEGVAQTLCALATDTSRRRHQEAQARAWDERHPSGSLLVQALAVL